MILAKLLPEVRQLSAQDKLKLIRLLAEELYSSINDSSLTELLDGIKEDNLHQEVEVGTAVGKEVW